MVLRSFVGHQPDTPTPLPGSISSFRTSGRKIQCQGATACEDRDHDGCGVWGFRMSGNEITGIGLEVFGFRAVHDGTCKTTCKHAVNWTISCSRPWGLDGRGSGCEHTNPESSTPSQNLKAPPKPPSFNPREPWSRTLRLASSTQGSPLNNLLVRWGWMEAREAACHSPEAPYIVPLQELGP